MANAYFQILPSQLKDQEIHFGLLQVFSPIMNKDWWPLVHKGEANNNWPQKNCMKYLYFSMWETDGWKTKIYLRNVPMQVIHTGSTLFWGPAYKQEEIIVTTLNNHNRHEEKRYNYHKKIA